jgi:iron complex transport system substrate-binding protein
MIYDMGLQDLLYGVTFECPAVAAEKPAVVKFLLEGKNYSSVEIDKIFSASKAQGKSLYYVEEELLERIAPDVIFTQDVCEVCQIDTACTASAVAKLKKAPRLVPLSPGNLDEVFQTAVVIAGALGREEAAYSYLSGLQKKIDAIVDELRRTRAPLKRALVIEWMDPVYNGGHWIPYQVAYAGGVDMLSNPGGDSVVTSWEKIVRYDPEVIVIAPCGFRTGRAMKELYLLRQKNEWAGLKAVANDAVFLADYDLFTQPSPATLVDGISLLAALFHPEVFSVPESLRSKYISVTHKSQAYAEA